MMNLASISDFVHSISSKLTWVLIDSSIKAAVLLAIAAVINGLWRRCSAAIRDRIWTLAFCGAIILPAISSIVPQWRIPIFRITPPASRSGHTAQAAGDCRDCNSIPTGTLPQINSHRIDPMTSKPGASYRNPMSRPLRSTTRLDDSATLQTGPIRSQSTERS